MKIFCYLALKYIFQHHDLSMNITEMSDRTFIQMLCEFFLLRIDNSQAGGLFCEYNKHVALRYVLRNLTKIVEIQRTKDILNAIRTEHYKAHSLINYHISIFINSIL